MKTYQDYEAETGSLKKIIEFVQATVSEYKCSEMYKDALQGYNYTIGKNTVIERYKKFITNTLGQKQEDAISANHKMSKNTFKILCRQESKYLMSNGVYFADKTTKEKLGKKFDTKLSRAAYLAVVQRISYVMFNYDRVEVFPALEVAPLFDETSGELRAIVRFWRISDKKPMHYYLYTEAGYLHIYETEHGVVSETDSFISYKQINKSTAYEQWIEDGGNYGRLPIFPVHANADHTSELTPIKKQIDAYDLIKSGFANDLDDAAYIYWTLENCGGMTEKDLSLFVKRMHDIKAANVDGDEGARAEAHTIDVPYASRETYLKILKKDIYEDFGGVDVDELRMSNATNTQIKAAFAPLDEKADELEENIIEVILDILQLAGIDDYPVLKRNIITNDTEQTQAVIMAASVLDTETVVRHLPFITIDEVDDVLQRVKSEAIDRVETDGSEYEF